MSQLLDSLRAEVEENRGAIDSAVTLITGIRDKLDEAIAENDPAALTALRDALDAQTQVLAEAVSAHSLPGEGGEGGEGEPQPDPELLPGTEDPGPVPPAAHY
jgi:hypothetical protein